MSFLRNISLFAMTILNVVALILIVICLIRDSPLYLDNSESRIEALEQSNDINTD